MSLNANEPYDLQSWTKMLGGISMGGQLFWWCLVFVAGTLFGFICFFVGANKAKLLAYIPYVRDLLWFRRLSKGDFPISRLFPCLFDRYETSGNVDGHYFVQDMFVARRIFENVPQRHVDIGSRVDGFVSHVAVFRPITVIDIRPAPITASNIEFIQADFSKPIDSKYLMCFDSVSCLHAIEHFGLGRYSDPVDPEAWKIGVENLKKLLRPGGVLYFSVPIGRQRVEFNAHRVFDIRTVLAVFSDGFTLRHFSYVGEDCRFHENVVLSEVELGTNYGCHYGCGIFEFVKD